MLRSSVRFVLRLSSPKCHEASVLTGCFIGVSSHLQSSLSAWLQRKKHCVLLTTHSMEEAEALSSRIAVLRSGRIEAIGTPQELVQSIGSDYIVCLDRESGVAVGESALYGNTSKHGEPLDDTSQASLRTVQDIKALLTSVAERVVFVEKDSSSVLWKYRLRGVTSLSSLCFTLSTLDRSLFPSVSLSQLSLEDVFFSLMDNGEGSKSATKQHFQI